MRARGDALDQPRVGAKEHDTGKVYFAGIRKHPSPFIRLNPDLTDPDQRQRPRAKKGTKCTISAYFLFPVLTFSGSFFRGFRYGRAFSMKNEGL